MFSSTLGDIKSALRQNDRQTAIDLLADTLREKPSADAWYLAATLTHDHAKKVKCLQTALFMDPKHIKSKDLLRELGEKPAGVHRFFASELIYFIHEQSQKSPLLRRLPVPLQVASFFSVIVIFLVLFGVLLSVLIPPAGPTLSAEAPPAQAVDYISTSDVMDHLYSNELEIMYMTETEQGAKQSIRLDVRDTEGTLRAVEIFVYDSISALIDDRTSLSIYEQYSNVVAHSNAVLTYPHEVPEEFATYLISVFEGITPQQS